MASLQIIFVFGIFFHLLGMIINYVKYKLSQQIKEFLKCKAYIFLFWVKYYL